MKNRHKHWIFKIQTFSYMLVGKEDKISVKAGEDEDLLLKCASVSKSFCFLLPSWREQGKEQTIYKHSKTEHQLEKDSY